MKTDTLSMWSRLSALAGRREKTEASRPEAPYGFALRVVARWREDEAAARFQFWRLWSLRAAGASLAFSCLAFFVRTSPPENLPEAVALLDTPGLSIPQP